MNGASEHPAAGMEQWSFPAGPSSTSIPAPDQPYWFPHRETMDPERRDAAILERIRAVMAYAWERAPFYRDKWSAAGLHPADVRSLDDFEQVPVVTKEELRRTQERHPPYGDYLCVGPSAIGRVNGTSGTTGRPTAFAVSRRDWSAIADAHARVMWAMGIRPTDTVFVGAIFSLYMGSWGALAGAERLGATVFPFGAGVAGMTTRAVSWLQQIRPTVLYGTPSYALRLAEVAGEMGVDACDLGLRKMFFSGEPGASVPAVRSQIESAFGVEVYDCGSMAEMTPWMHLAESTSRRGMLCWQDIVYTEVTDPTTHRRVPYGREGTPVYTHLERESQPMIRLLSNDLTMWEAPGSACGRTYPVLPRGIFGRIDDMFTVRGENVYPSAVDGVLTSIDGYGGEHRIVVSRTGSMDALTVHAEYAAHLADDPASVERFTRRTAASLQHVLGVKAVVVPVRHGTFARTDLKSNRVTDERNLFRSGTP
jgi:phenylacetate-CoA ligase